MMAFFSLYRLWIYGALVLALIAGAWRVHHAIDQGGYDRAKAEYAAQVVKVDAKREAVAAPIAAKQEAAQVQIRTVFKTITKEVPVYVKADDCAVSGGFRVYFNAAANGTLPDPARIADAAPVAAQDLADIIVENDRIYYETAERLRGLQQWVTDQAALKN